MDDLNPEIVDEAFQRKLEKREIIVYRVGYGMVLAMILITVAVFLYMVKKTFDARKEYLRKLEEKEKEGYAKLTIQKEQEDLMEDQLAGEDEDFDEIVADFQDGNAYEEFLTDELWEDFFRTSVYKKKELEMKHHNGAELRASMYYQGFAKYLKLHLVSLNNLVSYEISASSSIKLKVMITNNINGRQLVDVTKSYPCERDIDVNEKLIFKIEEEELKSSTLYISMFCEDIFYQEYLLGAVSLDLSIANYRIRQTISEEVIPVKKDRNVYGYLLISLCHVPCVERVVCVVLCGKDLKVDMHNTSVLDNIINPYVKISLLNDGKLSKCYKTKVLPETCSPSINEMFEFYISDAQLQSTDILIMVMHKDSNHSHQTIGKLLIGNHALGVFCEHWHEAIAHPGIAIPKWHPIMKGYP